MGERENIQICKLWNKALYQCLLYYGREAFVFSNAVYFNYVILPFFFYEFCHF
jgi:hypothetical protein